MSEHILNQILEELQSVKKTQSLMHTQLTDMKETQNLMQTQLTETNEIVHAIRDRQDETDAKLENLTFQNHKLQGDVVAIKEIVNDIKGEIEFTYEKTSRNELEIFKLRKEQAE